MKYKLCDYVLPKPELNDLISPAYVNFMREQTSLGKFRGSIFRSVRKLVESKTSIKDFTGRLHKCIGDCPKPEAILNIFQDIIPDTF